MTATRLNGDWRQGIFSVNVDAGGGNDVINITSSDPAAVQIEIFGEGGNDTVNGQGADEAITIVADGGADNDSIVGGAGNDVLAGGSGNDGPFGANGNDTLTGGTGEDGLFGGSGDDLLYANDNAADGTIDGGEGHDTAHYDTGVETVANAENPIWH